MTFTSLVTALAIPAEALVDQRVPKKLLAEQGAPTVADRRRIQDGIEEITWVAALKPTNIGVPAFKDGVREYLEISVLTVAVRSTAKLPRLIELIHRAVPYPVILFTVQSGNFNLSLAHKRWSQGEAGKVVIEDVRQVSIQAERSPAEESSFLASLALSSLPARNLFVLYDGLLDRLAALEAARITGIFAPPDSDRRSAILREGLDDHVRLERQLGLLRVQAKKEKQINRRVQLNLEIKELESKLAHVTANLEGNQP